MFFFAVGGVGRGILLKLFFVAAGVLVFEAVGVGAVDMDEAGDGACAGGLLFPPGWSGGGDGCGCCRGC